MNNSSIIFIGNYQIEGYSLSVMYWEETSIYTGVLRFGDQMIISNSHAILENLIADITKSVEQLLQANKKVSAVFN